MERRDFLKVGVIGGAGTAAVGTLGCAGTTGAAASPIAVMSPAEMDRFLARLDGGLDALKTGEGHLTSMYPKLDVTDPKYPKQEKLVRKTLRSLLLVGSFNDLPEEARVHPGMQARMWNGMGEMDEAMLGMTSELEALTPTERADIGLRMRKDPGLGMRIVEAIDEDAAKAGISMERRLHLRSIAAEACARMKQSTPLLIDEYVTKVNKVAARPATAAEFERRLVAQMGEDAFFQLRERTEMHARRWNVASTDPTNDANGPYAPKSDPHQRSSTVLSVGGILLGVGALALLIGGICVSASLGGGVFAMTAGAILGIAGLITLIVGSIMRAAEG
ncbi:hypothetical protein [Polyangium jinanense]|uniref:Uncharacterized protein n=1 Tax=Polyangium jinanense TaxID=2829994 RepID=A0A9X3WZ21_9BACT|nr:hypothetical protein [Polyangium jinanense]MDC3954631.1 hypothetical protein [Polyangium jinanense]MDC3980934.1 hypothetical protein [Polyangium jinanense]